MGGAVQSGFIRMPAAVAGAGEVGVDVPQPFRVDAVPGGEHDVVLRGRLAAVRRGTGSRPAGFMALAAPTPSSAEAPSPEKWRRFIGVSSHGFSAGGGEGPSSKPPRYG